MALVVGGIIALGRLAQGHLRKEKPATLPFISVNCDSPPGMSKLDFLGEVQYLAGCPDVIDLNEPDLDKNLVLAFERHPWVAKVDGVECQNEQIHIQLTFRLPVMAVPWSGADGPFRAVDGQGVLLPMSAMRAGLPVFSTVPTVGADKVGSPWRDPAVQAACRALAKVGLAVNEEPIEEVEIRNGEVWLRTASGWLRPETEAAGG